MHRQRPVFRRSSHCPAVGAVLLVVGLASRAGAQEGFALGKFQPTFAGDRLFAVPSPAVAGDKQFHVMLFGDYAHTPLILATAEGSQPIGAIVAAQLLVHANVSFSFLKRVTVNVDLPVGFQRGDGPTGGGMTFARPTSAGLGDLRVGARASLLGKESDRFQLGIAAFLWAPTGSRAAYTSDGSVRGQPMVLAGGSTRRLVWSFALGPELRSTDRFVSVTPGVSLRGGTGAAFLPGDGDFQIGPEVTFGIPTSDLTKQTTDLELLLGAKHRFARDFVVGFAASFGLLPGVGTPDTRTVLSLAYTPAAPATASLDGDRVGVADAADACPDQPGVPNRAPSKNGCAPVLRDRDGDGVPDTEDACPFLKGVHHPVPKLNGCPADSDGDGIADAEDACPAQPGVANLDPKKNGCAALVETVCQACPTAAAGDKDGDGIPDDKDACPAEKGPPDPDPRKSGCPHEIRVTEGQIVMLQQVEFDTGKATIQTVSGPLLDAVAQAFRNHPEIVKVEIGGHTDSRGSAQVNTALSEARAEAVRAALIKRGVASARLLAKGYGPLRPVMANVTTAGRQKNRRVEFQILERR